MKTSNILAALMLLLSASVWAEEKDTTRYHVMRSTTYTVVNGRVDIPDQNPVVGTKDTVYAKPITGYGLSTGVFYAIRRSNGTLSTPIEADNISTNPDDRANETQMFSFTMPAADVEVWATFTALCELQIHQNKNAKCKLMPTYGVVSETDDYVVAKNIPMKPIILVPQIPDDLKKDYELVEAKITNINPSFVYKGADTIKIYMPTTTDIVHVTPVFGKKKYEVTYQKSKNHVQAIVSNESPKSRDEVDLTLLTDKGWIPANVVITGCETSWLVGKPERLENGGWKTVYRFKMNFKDIEISYGIEPVYSFSVKNTNNSKRVKTFVPEMIPGYPGVARNGQKIPVAFMMPDSFGISYNVSGTDKATVAYHNALKNSFADQGMDGWDDLTETNGNRLPVMVFTDSVGNKYWRTSGENSMSQTVDISEMTFPASAKEGKNLKIAAIASVNPCRANLAMVSIVAKAKDGKSEIIPVADVQPNVKDWITEFKICEVDTTAAELKLLVEAKADDPNKRSYIGPMFDDLCLLLPTKGDTIRNEDVVIFTMENKDVTFSYTPTGKESTVSVVKTEHANLTLVNTVTGEQGDTVKVMKDDVIVIKGKADDGYAIYQLSCAPPAPKQESQARRASDEEEDDDNEEGEEGSGGDDGYEDFDVSTTILYPDSIDMVANTTSFRHVIPDNGNLAITPTVDQQKVKIQNYYGGKLTVKEEFVKRGDTVFVTVKPKPGCQLKQIRTFPANAVELFKEVKVDKNTGAGTYSFVMPTAYITLNGEYIVPITAAGQLDSLSQHYGTFRLDNDLKLGNNWDKKQIKLVGEFDGNGHRITYGGNTSLFHTIESNASVRHLYVNANVKGSPTGDEAEDYIGGICVKNKGIIEDCEISGSVKNERVASSASSIAGLNGAEKEAGTIAYCHILCDGLDARTTYGIARQEKGSVIRDNVFSGMFVNGDGRAYMICNNMDSVTIERNYYVPSAGNSRAMLCNGVTAATTATLTNALKNVPNTNYVFTASIKSKYVGGYEIKLVKVTNTELNISTDQANAGTVVTGSVSVSGNNHLESITISAPDGSDSFQCPFTDNTDNVYTFSFTMPGHAVQITPQIAVGSYIYTPAQFANIDDKSEIYYLARDIDLNNWGKAINLKGTFHGNGHTIRYQQEGATSGLFNRIRTGAVLEGLRVVGIVSTTENCGGIVNENKGTIRNCHFSGQITRIVKSKKQSKNKRVAALVYTNAGNSSSVDHCSATGDLIIRNNVTNEVTVINDNQLYAVSDKSKVTNCVWISKSPTASECQTLRTQANAASKDYPVFAQGILDKTDARVVTGNHSQTVSNGQSLNELTITDGEPFVCTSDVKVNMVIYKRKATKDLQPWVLPFAFNQIAGNGKFTYHEAIEKNNKPDLGPANTLRLSDSPQSVKYEFNKPWVVSNGEDGAERTYVLSNAGGIPITIHATSDYRVARYASLFDVGSFFAAYDTIPAKTVNDELMYVWNANQKEFALPDGSTPILPNRFYLQFYNTNSKKFIKYAETQWAKNESATPKARASASRRAAEVVADGWQPIFLDPREPQSITARMLDYYEVAYLTDINTEVLGEDGDSPLSAVSLVYMMANGRMDLPPALPLLVRAKRSDAEPLVDEKTGAELEELLMQLMEEEESDYEESDFDDSDEDDDDDDDDSSDFDMPDYWCASFDNRLDIWHLPAPERHADLAEYGGMVFNDNYYDQSFLYAKANDTRTTSPMSYCLTLLNTKTYELLPLLGDRVSIEFLVPADETTGISSPMDNGQWSMVNGQWSMVNGQCYNLNGQRVDSKYKGIIVQKGRKIFKR